MWDLRDEDYASEEHITAAASQHYFLTSRGLTREQLHCHPVVLAAFQPGVYRALVKRTNAQPAAAWVEEERAPLAHGSVDGASLSVILLPVGAPWTVLLCEQLVEMGARTIIATGAAGSLQERLPIGSLVVPSEALREEGTSYHYVPAGVAARPDLALAAELAAACRASGVEPGEGTVWTTDGVFREMRSKVERFAARQVLAVDMEASAMFVLGAFRHVAVASLFIISDELFHPWRPAFYDQHYRRQQLLAAEIAIQVGARRARAV